MRFWDPADPEMAAADAEPWRGPLSSAMRPIPLRTATRLTLMAAVLSLQAPIGVLFLKATATEEMVHPQVVNYFTGFVILYGLSLPVLLAALPARILRASMSLGVVLWVITWIANRATGTVATRFDDVEQISE